MRAKKEKGVWCRCCGELTRRPDRESLLSMKKAIERDPRDASNETSQRALANVRCEVLQKFFENFPIIKH